jgi:hypothetical protein
VHLILSGEREYGCLVSASSFASQYGRHNTHSKGYRPFAGAEASPKFSQPHKLKILVSVHDIVLEKCEGVNKYKK